MTPVATDRKAFRWVLAGLGLFALIISLNPRRGIDLRVYLTAAERFWAHQPLYQEADGPMPFKYAPAAAWLFSPFTLLPARLALPVWNLLSVGALAWALRRLQGAVPELAATTSRTLAFTLLALAQPFFLEFHYGQVDLPMLALLVGTVTLAHRPALAGLCLAVALVMKPPALLLAMFLLFERQWRTLAFAALWQVVLWAPVLLRSGVAGTLQEVHEWGALVARTTAPWALGHNPQGWPTLLLSLIAGGSPTPTDSQISLAQVSATALFVVAVAAARIPRWWRFAVVCLGIALLSPLCWRANLVLALPLCWMALASGLAALRWPVVLLGVVGMLVNDAVFSAERFRELMFLRPFAWALTLLFLAVLWKQRAAPATSPREASLSAG